MLSFPFKKTGQNVSALGLGLMRLPKLDDQKPEIDFEKAKVLVDYAYQNGINYFDTAYPYHGQTSEKFAGYSLSQYPRDSYFLATKMPGWLVNSEDDLPRFFEEQLENCKTDYFDFYLMHSVSQKSFDERYEKYHIFEFLQKKQEEGLIKNLGLSFHDKPDVLAMLLKRYPLDFVQIQLNYLDWEMQDAKTQFELLKNAGVPAILMEPVRGGALSDLCPEANARLKAARPDASIASWALRYAASLPNLLTVLSGMSNMEQLKENIELFSNFEPMSDAEYQTLEQAKKLFLEKETIPCTACRYCTEQCPEGINIPRILEIMNHQRIASNVPQSKKMLATQYFQEELSGDRCIECGVCVGRCPQFIDIPQHLKAIHQMAQENQ